MAKGKKTKRVKKVKKVKKPFAKTKSHDGRYPI